MQHTEGFLKLVNEAKARIRECDAARTCDRQERGESFHMIDVREESEWHNGRIAGAVHIGRGIIERDIERRVPDHGAEIILYCGGGYRSALAADALQQMGYTNVFSMAGGWRVWNEKGFPIER
jgi:rhodanese-related sulfurtransferase